MRQHTAFLTRVLRQEHGAASLGRGPHHYAQLTPRRWSRQALQQGDEQPSAGTLLVNLAGAVLFAALFLADQRAAGARVQRRTQVWRRLCGLVLAACGLRRHLSRPARCGCSWGAPEVAACMPNLAAWHALSGYVKCTVPPSHASPLPPEILLLTFVCACGAALTHCKTSMGLCRLIDNNTRG